MSKNKFYSSTSVFSQLLNLIPKTTISNLIKEHNSDHCYKKFKTYDHLVTMLYASVYRCDSLRELASGLQANYKRLMHLGLKDIPRKSTISDSNSKRNRAFFEALYHALYQEFYIKSDSRKLKKAKTSAKLFLLDSTTIKLFSDIMKGAGSKPSDGKCKGGAKAHVLLDAEHDIPAMIRITEAKDNDKSMLAHLSLPEKSVIVFDRAYRNYKIWHQFTQRNITWVTRAIGDETMEIVEDREVQKQCSEYGVIEDQLIRLGSGINKNIIQDARIIRYKDPESLKDLIFITNNTNLEPSQIAELYKKRWQIETFFKRIKRHTPLKYFLGNNENAVTIQIWCSFITDLLIQKVQHTITRKWSFANLAGIVRHHAMNYIRLFYFLNNPETSLIPKHHLRTQQLKLNFENSG